MTEREKEEAQLLANKEKELEEARFTDEMKKGGW